MKTQVNQFSILLLATLFISLLSSFLQVLVFEYFGIETHSNYIINGLITQVLVFIGGGLLYLKLTGQKLFDTVAINKPHTKGLLITLTLFLTAMLLSYLCSMINLWLTDFEYLKTAVLKNEAIVALQAELIASYKGFEVIYALAFFAVLPAIAEEFLFRGLLQKIMIDWTKSVFWGIILTAICFSIMHFQIQSVLPIFTVGVILGYAYYRLNNIWYPIIIHFLYNAIQVLIVNLG